MSDDELQEGITNMRREWDRLVDEGYTNMVLGERPDITRDEYEEILAGRDDIFARLAALLAKPRLEPGDEEVGNTLATEIQGWGTIQRDPVIVGDWLRVMEGEQERRRRQGAQKRPSGTEGKQDDDPPPTKRSRNGAAAARALVQARGNVQRAVEMLL